MANKDLSTAVNKNTHSNRFDDDPHYERKSKRAYDRDAARRIVSGSDEDPDDVLFSQETRNPWRRYRSGGSWMMARRWLDSQVGKDWDKVFSRLCTKFDQRSEKHRFMFNAIDSMIVKQSEAEARYTSQTRWGRRTDFFIGIDGKLYDGNIMRRDDSHHIYGDYDYYREQKLLTKANAFCGNRSIIRHASGGLCWAECGTYTYFNKDLVSSVTGEIIIRGQRNEGMSGPRQTRTLTKAERKYWDRFPENIKRRIEIRPE